MQFNQALPLLSRPKYAEGTALSSSRDDRNNSFLWKKGELNGGQIDGSTQALQKLSRQVSKMRRKPLGGYMPPPPVPEMYPFRIYNIQNATLTPSQLAQFTSKNANPDNFCFQLRNGFASCRPYLGVNYFMLDTNYYNGTIAGIMGNNEIAPYPVGTDTVPSIGQYVDYYDYPAVPNSGTAIVLPSTGAVLINGIPAGSPVGTAQTSYQQVFANPILDDYYGESLLSFWIEIVDDPLNGTYLNLNAQMWTTNISDSTGRTNYPFPVGQNIIPIGVGGYSIYLSQFGIGHESFSQNYQTGNIINRYVEQDANFRGTWNDIFAPTSPAADGLIFYNGDMVFDDKTLCTSGGINFYRTYVFINQSPQVLMSDQNPAGGANSGWWKNVGCSIL